MGNDLDKQPPLGDRQQSGQSQNQSKNPNTQEFPERKDREGSEDVEKRRAS